jgi:hypothetical protein
MSPRTVAKLTSAPPQLELGKATKAFSEVNGSVVTKSNPKRKKKCAQCRAACARKCSACSGEEGTDMDNMIMDFFSTFTEAIDELPLPSPPSLSSFDFSDSKSPKDEKYPPMGPIPALFFPVKCNSPVLIIYTHGNGCDVGQMV